MPPIIHCVRHAQAYHNLGTPEHNHSLRDPALTDLGKQQCAALRAAFPHHARVSAVVASPLRRTLWTALLAFGPGVRVVALPEIQENSGLPCDVGGERGALEREFAGLSAAADLDFALVADGWNVKAGPWAAEAGAVAERCRRARVRLREMVGEGEEGEVVAVTHGGLLHSFTEDWSDFDRHDGMLCPPVSSNPLSRWPRWCLGGFLFLVLIWELNKARRGRTLSSGATLSPPMAANRPLLLRLKNPSSAAEVLD